MSKISLNPKYTNTSGYSWSTTTYNNLKYYISTNKNSDSVSTLKCEFTTPYDNIDVVVQIGSSSENNYDWCYIGKLDDSNPSYNGNYLNRVSGYVGSNYAPSFETVTINVAKAGTHFLIIGYRKDGSGSYGNDCGYFRLDTTEVDSMEPTKYIYCGKSTIEEQIKFTKTDTSGRGWKVYTGTDSRFQWSSNSVSATFYNDSKITFITNTDNVVIDIVYKLKFSGAPNDAFYISHIDDTIKHNGLDMIYRASYNDGNSSVKVTIGKAGTHYFYISYKNSSYDSYEYIGVSGVDIISKELLPNKIFVGNRNIEGVYVGSNLIWGRKKYLPKFSIYLQGTGIGNTQYTFKYDNSHVFNSTKIDDDNIVINYDTDSLTQSKDNNFNNAITPTGWNNNSVTFKLVNTTTIDDTINKGVEIFKGLKVKKLDLTELDLTNSPNFNSFNNIFINLGAYNNPVNVVTGHNFDTQYITNFEGAFASPKSKVVFDFSKSPKFKISSSANIKNIFYGSKAGDLNWCEFILNKNIDDYTKSIFTEAVNSNKIKVSYI